MRQHKYITCMIFMFQVLSTLLKAPNCMCTLELLMNDCQCKDVMQLARKNIVLVERTGEGVVVRFHSRLTRRVVEGLLTNQ